MIQINKNICNNCGICYDVCPCYVFKLDRIPDKKVITVRYPDFCNKCAHCVALCPLKAIYHESIASVNLEKLHKINITTYDIKNLIFSRHSVRCFKSDPVAKDLIDQMIESAIYAGTSGNLQTEQFSIINNEKKLNDLEELVIDLLWNGGVKFFSDNGFIGKLLSIKYGNELTAHYKNTHKIIKQRRENNELKGMILRNAHTLILVHGLKMNSLGYTNSAIAIRNMELVALTLGLGTCWAGQLISAANMNSQKINKFIGLDKSRKIYGAIMVGYPKYRINIKLPRNSREIFTI
ncbi:MAG: nitroreductase family protein [Candidatus Firestonebacteria bacterium]|nr:nitroreductase family protein [Candidatus Firestonebacteria bacterium]